MKQNYLIIAAIFFGIIAAYLFNSQIQAEKDKMNSMMQDFPVLVATANIDARDFITRDNVEERIIKISKNDPMARLYIKPEFLTIISNKETKVSIKQGSYITFNDIDMGRDMGTTFSSIIPQSGLRAVTIDVDPISAVACLVRPGDHVDVIGTFSSPDNKGDLMRDLVTYTVLQNVVVLATGTDYGQNYQNMANNTRGYNSITFQVSQLEAELLIFARQKGKLTLTLRGPQDTKTNTSVKQINFDYMEKNISDFAARRNGK